MNLIADFAGEVCKILFPIRENVLIGNSKSNIAICVLSSIKLMQDISNSSLFDEVAIVGRLFSENKGIDSLVRSVTSQEQISVIILCGKDVLGHKSGHSLLCLHKNGIDENHKIIGSQSPYPFLTVTKKEVSKFQRQVKIINKIGETSIQKLKTIIETQ